MSHRLVALIPARAGSKRLAKKNVRELADHPLLVYAIAAAQESELFERIIVSTDDVDTGILARSYGADWVPRPSALAQDWSPDIQWIRHAMETWRCYDAFAILRPTSPFRRGTWIRQAWQTFLDLQPVDSLRAMRLCGEHPGKMWRPIWDHGRLVTPLLPFRLEESPWHSSPTQELPPVYVQTAALEIAWTHVLNTEMISGETVTPFLTDASAPESVDVNTLADWLRAEALATAHPEYLPPVRRIE